MSSTDDQLDEIFENVLWERWGVNTKGANDGDGGQSWRREEKTDGHVLCDTAY